MSPLPDLKRIMLKAIERRLAGELTDYERSILWHGAAWFFLILCSYYIIRPIREQIGSSYQEQLPLFFWMTFVVMLVAIPLYSMLVGRFHRQRLVPCIYLFFIGCLALFWAGMNWLDARFLLWIEGAFFVWISVYGLFVVSFFWSVTGDMLSTAQGRRIFGIMAGGGTIGGLIGSQVAGRLVERIGVANLLLIPIGLLGVSLVVYASLERAFARLVEVKQQDGDAGKATGGNPFAGFTAVFRSRYLMAICLFGMFMAACGTTVYFQQAEIVNAAYQDVEFDASLIENADSLSSADLEAALATLQAKASKAASTEYFANINFSVSMLTLLFQFVIVGALMKRVGLGVALAILPLAFLLGISALALSPTLPVLIVVTVLGRSVEYGICNPAREVLFTAVDREDRYKAKSFIDTVVRRGGDSAVGGVYQHARETMGLAMSTLSWIMIPFAIAWIGLSLFIGLENRKILAAKAPDDPK